MIHRYADYRWLRGFSMIPSWGARIEQAWWDYDGSRFREEAAMAGWGGACAKAGPFPPAVTVTMAMALTGRAFMPGSPVTVSCAPAWSSCATVRVFSVRRGDPT